MNPGLAIPQSQSPSFYILGFFKAIPKVKFLELVDWLVIKCFMTHYKYIYTQL